MLRFSIISVFQNIIVTMKWILAILLLSIVIDESLCQRGGRRGNRPLRQRQRQGRLLAAQNPLGPPPQPAVLLSNADPIFLTTDEELPFLPQALPRQGRQFRQGRQQSPIDDDGNYNFDILDEETGSTFRENGAVGNVKSGEVSWISPEGEEVQFSYEADENGYQAQGSHQPIPVPLPNGDPDGPGGKRNNLEIWRELMEQGRRR